MDFNLHPNGEIPEKFMEKKSTDYREKKQKQKQKNKP